VRKLYPQAEVIEAWNGPEETGYTPEIQKLQEEFILQTLDGRHIDAFFCSEPYGEHVSQALGAKCEIVDQDRVRIPVSGTLIRADPAKYREWVDPVVYRDLIVNAVFLGGPSTGKSTLVGALAKEYGTESMLEYGREYWDAHQVDRRLTRQQLVELAEGHLEREEQRLLRADRYLFTDTNAITTYLFSLHYHGSAEPRLLELAQDCAKRYDLFFLCDIDIPYDDTWDRSGDINRQEMQRRTVAFLQEYKIPYFTVRGTLEERISQVKGILERYTKYENIAELTTP
jgi:NadR type nicotinamide-nucleotide adenylyltransferase